MTKRTSGRLAGRRDAADDPHIEGELDYHNSGGSSEEEGSSERETLKIYLPRAAQLAQPDAEVDSAGPPMGELRPDHANRPIWLTDEGRIFLESFTRLANAAQDFLVAIAEPVSRPTFIHEYRLTAFSLYAAVSVGLETERILAILDRLSKTALPEGLVRWIRQCTVSYAKVRMVLRRGKYFVESAHLGVLQTLLRNPAIEAARVTPAITTEMQTKERAGPAPGEAELNALPGGGESGQDRGHENEDEGEEEEEEEVHSFEVDPNQVEAVKRCCNEMDYPTLEEYDFRADHTNPNLIIDLKPTTTIRPYQERSLSKMFGNSRARSGIIVLPCGAGKTLVGITAACTIKKSVMVLCTSAVAVEQWRQQFKAFSTVGDGSIARFTSDAKERFTTPAGILISTYTMVAYGGKRSYEARKVMDWIRGREWGLMILDEVHVVPALVFRRVLNAVASHAKLGLTATLVREDDRITDLNFLIGPKLYEANWLDLARQGHIASVQCAEVWCPMPADFYRAYLQDASRRRRLLYVMNPTKFQTCQYLIDVHEKRGDKIIVFSDNVYALQTYAKKLGKPFIYGPTSQQERLVLLSQFQHNPNVSTIFLSKVGDTSIDLPEATCLIQISSHYGSRRQEAQRLGRILRAKRRGDLGFTAFFYSLVSRDTEEMYYSAKRQQFLIDQGYAFRVITELKDMDKLPNLAFSTPREQRELLTTVLQATEEDAEDEQLQIADDLESATRVKGSLRELSGAGDMAYMERNRPVGSQTNAQPAKNRHKLFKQYYK